MFSLNKIKIYFLYLTLLISGAVILVMEIAGARLLAPFYGSTVFVWSALIVVALGFLALGYFVGGFFADKYPKGQYFYFIIFLGGAIALLLIKLNQPLLVFSNKFGFKFGPLIAALLLFSLPFFFLSMASPFAIRLRSRELEQTGRISGIVFGSSTIGSLFGALLAGFYLIPNFFVLDILTVSAISAMITAIIGLFLERSLWRMRISSILLFFLLFFLPFIGSGAGTKASVIYRQPSFYGEIQVVERNGFRCLSVNNQSQTCIGSNGEQALKYGNMIKIIAKNNFQTGDRALVIGLGGGIVARDLSDNFKTVETIEIDSQMVSVAKEFFGYDDSGPKLSTHIADGRNYIQTSNEKYDMIILDAFSGANPAPHLYTKEAFEEMKNILTSEGMLIVNTIGRPYGQNIALTHSVFKTLNSVFPHLTAISTENIAKEPTAFGNILLAASFNNKEIFIKEDFIIDYNEDDLEEGVLLTDAYNPIEMLGLPICEESQKNYHRLFLGSL